MIKKFLYFFNKHQKRALLLFFILMLVSTILEMVGLGFIFSIVGTLNPTNAENNVFINKLTTFFELDKTEILTYILIIFSLFLVEKVQSL